MRAVFFDLDGTLTDSGEGIVKSVDYALQKMSLPTLSGDSSWVIGPPLWDSFVKLGVARANLNQAITLYRERYTVIGYLESRLYDGILAQLAQLQQNGYKLCLATSKPHVTARKITSHFAISPYLSHQFGSEQDGTRSDKTSLLKHALAEVGVSAADAIMIGDRSHDAVGAHANGLKVLGAVYGFGTVGELQQTGVDGLIETPHDLAAGVIQHLPF